MPNVHVDRFNVMLDEFSIIDGRQGPYSTLGIAPGDAQLRTIEIITEPSDLTLIAMLGGLALARRRHQTLTGRS